MGRYIVPALLCVAGMGVAHAQSALQPIAEVNLFRREPVTLGQIKARISAIEKEMGKKLSTAERRQFMDSLIDEKLFAQAAEKAGIQVTDAEVNQYFNGMLSQQIGRAVTEAEFANYVKEKQNISLDQFMKQQNGMTMAEYKKFLKTQVSTQRYVAQKKADEFRNLKGPEDSQIRSYYELNKQAFFRPDTVKLFLISVPKGSGPAAAKAKAQEFVKKLKSSGVKATADIKSKANGAQAGYSAGEIYLGKTAVTATQLGLTMEALLEIFGMGVGAVSDVNETANDYQCFIVLKKEEAKILTLSDLVEPDKTVSLYEFIKNLLTSQIQQKALEDAIREVSAELRKSGTYKVFLADAELGKVLDW